MIKIKAKPFKILICIVAVAVITCLAVTPSFISKKASGKSIKFSVVIDAGHGGVDGGAVGDRGVSERELNLKIATKLKKCFFEHGFIVTMTRSDQNGLYGDATSNLKVHDLKKRVEIVNEKRPNVFISVHLNKFSQKSRRGAQVFYKQNSQNSKKLANSIQFSLNELKESKRMFEPIWGDYYVLNQVKCTAVLVECGFLSNPEEEELLISESYQQKLAYAIFNGTVRYLVNKG